MTVRDSFSKPRRAGRVVGSRSDDGHRRDGIDTEGVLSVDHQALRIEPLINAGWQKACLSYGPFERRPGLAFGAYVLNGHNTAQAEPFPETLTARLRFWLYGSMSTRARHRVWRLIRAGRVLRVLRQMRWWLVLSKPDVPRLDENLAIGFFSGPAANPMQDGANLVMHATGPENGELWARGAHGFGAVIRGVQNLPIYYVVVLRENDAIYYAGATAPAVQGLPAYPNLRPVAVGPLPEPTQLWGGIHQSVVGQVGFRCDTRVYGAVIAELEDWQAAFGGAHVAHVFAGEGPLDGSAAAVGGMRWRTYEGWSASGAGDIASTANEGALIDAPAPTGLLRTKFRVAAGSIHVSWRAIDAANRWEIAIDGYRSVLSLLADGRREIVATDEAGCNGPCDLQIADDGRTIALLANDRLLFGRRIEDTRLGDARSLGIELRGGDAGQHQIESIEAHPRTVAVPPSMDFGKPWTRTGSKLVVEDDFAGTGPLDGHVTPIGGRKWSRILGPGVFDLTGQGAARVRASKGSPCPGRTLYTVDWDNPEFADVEVVITPPGKGRGEWEHGLTGFVLWQDPDNYVTINIWVFDSYPGASISCFFNVRGWEDVYDAIWSNVNDKVRHGVPCKLRVTFDGMNYMVFVDDVAVLFRKLTDVYSDCTPFRINKVGLVANWEWGLDTGSVFNSFRGRI